MDIMSAIEVSPGTGPATGKRPLDRSQVASAGDRFDRDDDRIFARLVDEQVRDARAREEKQAADRHVDKTAEADDSSAARDGKKISDNPAGDADADSASGAADSRSDEIKAGAASTEQSGRTGATEGETAASNGAADGSKTAGDTTAAASGQAAGQSATLPPVSDGAKTRVNKDGATATASTAADGNVTAKATASGTASGSTDVAADASPAGKTAANGQASNGVTGNNGGTERAAGVDDAAGNASEPSKQAAQKTAAAQSAARQTQAPDAVDRAQETAAAQSAAAATNGQTPQRSQDRPASLTASNNAAGQTTAAGAPVGRITTGTAETTTDEAALQAATEGKDSKTRTPLTGKASSKSDGATANDGSGANAAATQTAQSAKSTSTAAGGETTAAGKSDVPVNAPKDGATASPVSTASIDDQGFAPQGHGVHGASASQSSSPVAAAQAIRHAGMAAPAEQIAVRIHAAVQDGTDRIRIQLNPSELGRIDVKLEIGHDGRLIATLQSDRSDTLDLMQRDARSLERALQDAGLKTDQNSLSFTLNRDQRQQAGGESNPPQDRAGGTGADIDATDGLDPIAGRVVTSDRALDLRV